MGINEILEKLNTINYELESALESKDWDEVQDAKNTLEELLEDADRMGDYLDYEE
tara:strand:+ start:4185 stop:4349 length:165 start_codon:yes stop_codon:yes gene_type:complete